MRDDRVARGSRRESREGAEQSASDAARGERQILSASSESSRYCGVCATNGIGHAVFGVEPEGRGRLGAARQRDDSMLVDVAAR